MLNFDPTTGLSAPSTAEVRAEVAAAFQNAFAQQGRPALNTAPETPAGQLVDSVTAMQADNDAALLYLANMFNPATASGIWQAALGQIYFIEPFTSRASVAACVCTGLQGTQIPAGALIRSTEDQTLWASLQDATIPTGGSIAVQFACQTSGPILAGAGTLSEIVTVTPGWDTVNNPAAAVTGSNAETQRAFELRRYNAVAANARGSVSALYGALSRVPGVIDLAVLENVTGEAQTISGVSVPGHSVFISIVGGTDADIAAAIYQKKDAGCGTAGNTQVTYTDTAIVGNPLYTYQINRPTPLAFGIQVTIKNTPTTPANIEALIKQAVLDDFNGVTEGVARVGTAQTVYSSRFYDAVIQGAGVSDLISIVIQAPTGSQTWQTAIDVTADQEPTLDAADITVIVQG